MSLERGADAPRFGDHRIDRFLQAISLPATPEILDLTRQVHQTSSAKMTATAFDGVCTGSDSSAVALAHQQADCINALAQVAEKDVDDFYYKLVAQLVVFGQLGDRAHVDRSHARGFNAHPCDRFKLRAGTTQPLMKWRSIAFDGQSRV